MLKVQQLSYQSRINSLSFTAASGQIIGVIGANGAGKSTLLKALAGILSPTAGSAYWHDQQMLAWRPMQRRQQLSFLPQQTQFLEPILVADALLTSQINLQDSEADLADWREQSIAQFNLEALLQRSVTELSGGEQRRVSIACMSAMNRSFIVVDEPIASLDLYYQLLTMDWLRERSQSGKLVLVALHDLALAAQYCDQLILLDRGHLVGVGTPNEVLSDANLAQAYQVSVDWLCNERGVAMLPRRIKPAQFSSS